MEKPITFKTTSFREDYNPTFKQFKASYEHIFVAPGELEEAFKALTGKDVKKNK